MATGKNPFRCKRQDYKTVHVMVGDLVIGTINRNASPDGAKGEWWTTPTVTLPGRMNQLWPFSKQRDAARRIYSIWRGQRAMQLAGVGQ